MKRKNGNPLPTFLITFLASGYLMKLLSEFIHEFGHGILVIIFGGRILEIFISPFWPLQLSWIRWSLPANIGDPELSIIYAGGIILCLTVSFSLQIFLILNRFSWFPSLPLAWLGFWCFLNGTGYLILGGLAPFGDIKKLIGFGCLTQLSSLTLGLGIFTAGFIMLSKILFNIFSELFSPEASRLAVSFFWMQIPIYCVFILGLRTNFNFMAACPRPLFYELINRGLNQLSSFLLGYTPIILLLSLAQAINIS